MMRSTAPSSILSAFGTLSIIFGGFSMQHGLTHAQCLDSEALLQVSYNDPSWENEERDDVIIRLSNAYNITDLTMMTYRHDVIIRTEFTTMSYSSNMTFTFEKCIARDGMCRHILVDGPLRDLYEISWDGRVLTDTEIGPEMPSSRWKNEDNNGAFFTATQFGDGCKPECGSDEALFEFQLRQYDTYSSYLVDDKIDWSFFVEDQNGTVIIASYGGRSHLGLHIKRMCLPKNDCYRLVMKDGSEFDVVHVVAFFDDKPIFEIRPFFYESVDFGDGCPACDPDKESKAQLFIHPPWSLPKRNPVSWEFTSHDAVSGSQVIHSGKLSDNYGIHLHYDEICVPQQRCITFSLQTETTFYGEYMLRMDDIIYRYYKVSDDDGFHTIHLGDCTEMMSSICNPANENLLELNFQTKPKPSSAIDHFPDVSDTFWSLNPFSPLFFSSDVLLAIKYEYDSAYRVLRCIPNIKCLYSLRVEGGNSFESYSIKMNGALSTAKTVVDRYSADEVTALDNDCKLIWRRDRWNSNSKCDCCGRSRYIGV